MRELILENFPIQGNIGVMWSDSLLEELHDGIIPLTMSNWEAIVNFSRYKTTQYCQHNLLFSAAEIRK